MGVKNGIRELPHTLGKGPYEALTYRAARRNSGQALMMPQPAGLQQLAQPAP